jgi:hypothetical protein
VYALLLGIVVSCSGTKNGVSTLTIVVDELVDGLIDALLVALVSALVLRLVAAVVISTAVVEILDLVVFSNLVVSSIAIVFCV